MDEQLLVDAVERYLNGEMTPEEIRYFEEMRRNNPEMDQLVVEHTLFLEQLNQFSRQKAIRQQIHEVDVHMRQTGEITEMTPPLAKAPVIELWHRYKKVFVAAAAFTGLITLSVAAITWIFASKPVEQIQQLSKKLERVESRTNSQSAEIKNLKGMIQEPTTPARFGGTGFLIDGKGYLVTNAHVVSKAKRVAVQNQKGIEYDATTVFVDSDLDIAILKITDAEFKGMGALPYAIRRSSTDLAEPIFTLGYPRDEVVYGQGYLSARTGFNGDTLTCQIAIEANPGNSGGPVFNRNGEVVGILSTREVNAEGVVFALQSKNIYRAIDMIHNDSTLQDVNITMPSNSRIKGMDRVQQVKKIQEHVFMVKGY